MISDILSNALTEIERYRTDPAFVQAYADPTIQEQIEALVEQMQTLLAALDAAPEAAQTETK